MVEEEPTHRNTGTGQDAADFPCRGRGEDFEKDFAREFLGIISSKLWQAEYQSIKPLSIMGRRVILGAVGGHELHPDGNHVVLQACPGPTIDSQIP